MVGLASPAGPVLQANADGLFGIALLGYELLGAVLGFFIAYLAYRGYRRNDSRPMLFIAIGFATILGVPTLGLLAEQVGLVIPSPFDYLTVQTAEVLGLLSIIYALRMDA